MTAGTAGYKPIATIDVGPDWDKKLSEIEKLQVCLPEWKLAVVLDVGTNRAKIGLRSGEIGFIENTNIGWKHEWRKNQKLGRRLKQLGDFMDRGSVVLVEMVDKHQSLFKLRQIPQVNGALIALDPHTGRVLAMTGGWSFESSEFNRATKHLDNQALHSNHLFTWRHLIEVIVQPQEYLMRHS